jgi:hypothetical protein
MSPAKSLDEFGKGGGMVDGKLVREFPTDRRAAHRNAGVTRSVPPPRRLDPGCPSEKDPTSIIEVFPLIGSNRFVGESEG